MIKVEDAVLAFIEGFSCSQAVLSTYGPDFGLDRELALKLATPFGGGMARMGETCGAVTGAFMVIGLKYGLTDPEKKEDKERTYEKINEFVEKFNERNKSIVCKDLLGHDLSTQEGREIVEDKALTIQKCPEFVKDAAEILEEVLGGELELKENLSGC
jgi:C_GCAxxG_C_C family probable redox protein